MTTLTESHWPARGGSEESVAIGDQLRARAEERGDAVALYGYSPGAPQSLSRWTYGDLRELATAGARALISLTGGQGRVAICAPNLPEWVFAYFSCAVAGMEVVPLNPALREGELRRILVETECSAFFVVEEHRGNRIGAMARRLRAEIASLEHVVDLAEWASFAADAPAVELPVVAPEDVALVQYTSGTTARSKGALLTHLSLTQASIRSGRPLGIGPDDVYANPFPLFHVGGTVGAIGVCLAAGASLALLPVYRSEEMIDLIAECGATLAAGVPTVLRGLLPHLRERPELAARLRAINTGATAVPGALIEDYAAIGIPLSVSYGQSECPTIARTWPSTTALPDAQAVGQPVDGLEVRLVDQASGVTVPLGEVGELWVRGTNVMGGYLGDFDATRAVLDTEGWLRTGDLATMSEDGTCSIVGRLKDLIIRGGENVYPREIEEVLMTHPDVQDAAVIGSPDEVFGEEVLAVVVMEPDRVVGWRRLAEFAGEKLAPFKVPRRWRLASELPRNAAGKVEKHRLDTATYETVEISRAASR